VTGPVQVSRQGRAGDGIHPGPAAFELEATQALAAWRAGRFELPDYYLVLARKTASAQ
jgi:hypothetical protein